MMEPSPTKRKADDGPINSFEAWVNQPGVQAALDAADEKAKNPPRPRKKRQTAASARKTASISSSVSSPEKKESDVQTPTRKTKNGHSRNNSLSGPFDSPSASSEAIRMTPFNAQIAQLANTPKLKSHSRNGSLDSAHGAKTPRTVENTIGTSITTAPDGQALPYDPALGFAPVRITTTPNGKKVYWQSDPEKDYASICNSMAQQSVQSSPNSSPEKLPAYKRGSMDAFAVFFNSHAKLLDGISRIGDQYPYATSTSTNHGQPVEIQDTFHLGEVTQISRVYTHFATLAFSIAGMDDTVGLPVPFEAQYQLEKAGKPVPDFHPMTSSALPCSGNREHLLLCGHRVATPMMDECGINCVRSVNAQNPISRTRLVCQECDIKVLCEWFAHSFTWYISRAEELCHKAETTMATTIPRTQKVIGDIMMSLLTRLRRNIHLGAKHLAFTGRYTQPVMNKPITNEEMSEFGIMAITPNVDKPQSPHAAHEHCYGIQFYTAEERRTMDPIPAQDWLAELYNTVMETRQFAKITQEIFTTVSEPMPDQLAIQESSTHTEPRDLLLGLTETEFGNMLKDAMLEQDDTFAEDDNFAALMSWNGEV